MTPRSLPRTVTLSIPQMVALPLALGNVGGQRVSLPPDWGTQPDDPAEGILRPQVLTLGYGAGVSVKAVQSLFDRHADLYLVDTRANPWSAWEEWQRAKVERVLGSRYRWLGDSLGNANWRKEDRGRGVRILDMERGAKRLVNAIGQGVTPILLCQCAEENTCHRAWIVSEMRRRGYVTAPLNIRRGG